MPRRKQEQNRDKTIKECSITVRISYALKEKLQRAAIKRGKTFSDYVNYLLSHRIPEPDNEETAPDHHLSPHSSKWEIIESPGSILRKAKFPVPVTNDIRSKELERLRNISTALQFQRDDGEITVEEYERKLQENTVKIRQWYKEEL